MKSQFKLTFLFIIILIVFSFIGCKKTVRLKNYDYQIPAEWEKQNSIWLQWPFKEQIQIYGISFEKTFIEIVKAVSPQEKVNIIIVEEALKDTINDKLKVFKEVNFQNIEYHVFALDDIWVKDNGPVFVKNTKGEVAIVDWKFNCWGHPEYPHKNDDVIPTKIGEKLSMPVYTAPLTMEGGSIDVNGSGSLMATKTSIINKDRNPRTGRLKIERILKKYLGVTNIIWLSGMDSEDPQLGGDITDCHIDGCARFVNENTILYSWQNNVHENSPWFRRVLKIHLEELKKARDENGNPFQLIPLPDTKENVKGVPYRGIYTNFLITNKTVLVPIYNDENDKQALRIIGEQFPDKKIIGIDCVDIYVKGGGMIHCVVQHQPAAGTQ